MNGCFDKEFAYFDAEKAIEDWNMMPSQTVPV